MGETEKLRLYLPWLKRQVRGDGYKFLFEQLHNTPFRWNRHVPMDENRESDGRNLRRIFCEDVGCRHEIDLEHPASFLEVLVALAMQMDDLVIVRDEEYTGAWTWFWELLHNCGLEKFTDEYCQRIGYRKAEAEIEVICDRVMDRKYNCTGRGGLFPMPRHSGRIGRHDRYLEEDQRSVELWYQMNEYVLRTGRA